MSNMSNVIKTDALDKPVNTKDTLIKLFSYVKAVRSLFFLAILILLSANGLQLLGPFLTGLIIDQLTFNMTSQQWSSVVSLVILMVVITLISAFLLYVLSALMIYITQKIVVKMRQDLFNKFMDLPVSYFDKHQIGDMISRISYDIDTINTTLSSDLVQLVGSFVVVVGAFLMMIWISLPLLSVFIVTLPLSLMITKFLANKTRPLFRKRSKLLGALNGYVEETISGLKTIKAYSQQENMLKSFKAKNHEASDAYYQADYYGSVMGPSIGFVNNISLTLISLIGSLLFLFGFISIGNISSFLLYSRKFSGPISEAANMIAELQSTLAAAERVFKVLEEPVEAKPVDVVDIKKEVKGKVVFENIDFAYIPNKPVIKDLNLHIQPGSLVAVVGPTGAGKTTMINLLMRFYDPQKGNITIDDINIKQLPYDQLRGMFAMVLQDSWLFHGSIYENIVYGRPDATMDEVIEICKEVYIHSFIEKTKDGYDTLIVDDGVNLSKGQKQLISIARAMLQNKPMIIFDEATSNVDTLTEKRIQKAMRKLMKNKTCFVIAHRLSTIINADLILVVNDGEIVEKGTHQRLMEKQGYYYRLYMAQFE